MLCAALFSRSLVLQHMQRMRCRNQLRSLLFACRMFAEDHDGRFPNQWTDCSRYFANCAKILDCPAGGNDNITMADADSCADYVLIPERRKGDPEDTVLAFERLGHHISAGGHVGFLNGVVTWCSLKEYEALDFGEAVPQQDGH